MRVKNKAQLITTKLKNKKAYDEYHYARKVNKLRVTAGSVCSLARTKSTGNLLSIVGYAQWCVLEKQTVREC